MSPLLLAHQGGWDEALMVLVPIGLFAFVLFMANRRAERVRSERERLAPDQPVQASENQASENQASENQTGVTPTGADGIGD